MQRVIRSICIFTDEPGPAVTRRMGELVKRFSDAGFVIQTQRICMANMPIAAVPALLPPPMYSSVGTLPFASAEAQLPDFFATPHTVAFNVDLANEEIQPWHGDLLWRIIREKPSHTFRFAYVFGNKAGSPFFPSAAYERNGFAVGMQSPDCAEGCSTLEEWFAAMQGCWKTIMKLVGEEPDFLGIDSSVAPLFTGHSSLVNFVRRLAPSFSAAVLSDLFLRITAFIQKENPKPVGLCGLMLPCLEDFLLAEEYELGNFSLERNLFLSMHCGLGIDTYPVGIDEDPAVVLSILRLVQGLAKKYGKPLSARFVSDGKAKIGEKTDFGNQYLKDVVVRPLMS